jgi:hypothetical protein
MHWLDIGFFLLVMIHYKCETMIYGVRAMLDLHVAWVVLQVDVCNASN